jgi:hypothetical protein
MNLTSILEKVDKKLAEDELGLAIQKCDAEMGELAINCLKAKKAQEIPAALTDKMTQIKESLKGLIGVAKQKIDSTPGAKTVLGGAGGAALGGMFGAMSTQKGDLETEEDFKNRRNNSAITGSLAGGAVGLSIPSLIRGLSTANETLTDKDTVRGGIRDLLINPTTILGTGGAMGGSAINKAMAILGKNELPSNLTSSNNSALRKATGNFSYLSSLTNKIPNNTLKAIAQKVLKRKAFLPIAGALAAPGAFNVMAGDRIFDQPVFE